MPSPRRRPKERNPGDLADLSWAEMVALSDRGLITNLEIHYEQRRRAVERYGGWPWNADLHPFGEGDDHVEIVERHGWDDDDAA